MSSKFGLEPDESEDPSPYTTLVLSLLDSIGLSLLHTSPSLHWIDVLTVLQETVNHPLLRTVDHSLWVRHPLLLSLRLRNQVEHVDTEVSAITVTSMDETDRVTQEVPMIHTEEVDSPSTSDIESIESILRYLLRLCGNSLFSPFLPVLTECFSTETMEGRESQMMLMTLLVYEALQQHHDVQIGVLLRLALNSHKPVQLITLQTLTYLHRFIFYDFSNKSGLFFSDTDSLSDTPGSSKRSRLALNSSDSIVLLSGYQATVSSFPSPVDYFLVRLQLPLTLIIDTASSLHKPMTSLLWIHSVTLPFTPDDTRIYSWNTIITYPSVVSHIDASSDGEEDTSEMADKRLCSDQSAVDVHTQTITEQFFSLLDKKSLNSQIVNSYLAAGNPYAALAVTQSGQTSQQMLIQCQTLRSGFAAAFQEYG